ncbi:hypothetical protein C8R47DRAFT_1148403 [Mycena vitilis]|nr:hypothetical protein C8R47DRAFT_1148403 [Mycena vitilis]
MHICRRTLERDVGSLGSTQFGERFPKLQVAVPPNPRRRHQRQRRNGSIKRCAYISRCSCGRSKAPHSPTSRTTRWRGCASRSTPAETTASPEKRQRRMGTHPTMLVGEGLNARSPQCREQHQSSYFPLGDHPTEIPDEDERTAAHDAHDIHDAPPGKAKPHGKPLWKKTKRNVAKAGGR